MTTVAQCVLVGISEHVANVYLRRGDGPDTRIGRIMQSPDYDWFYADWPLEQIGQYRTFRAALEDLVWFHDNVTYVPPDQITTAPEEPTP
jgi:hypothetical protein